MADTVHYHMERMVPELEDLEKRGLFTRLEIKEIVKRRRDFEYLLKRHSTLKPDYLRYLEYENKLERLRKLRKKALTRCLKGTGEKWKHSFCDRAAQTRIMLIYERAVKRFKGDLTLWLQYLEYCRPHAPAKMRKVVTRCLQLHPNVPGLWMYAAAWEFEQNLNVKAARALMQRGLRMCPRAENLWLEYFRMELTYMQKLKARRVVLGLESKTSSAGKQASKDKLGLIQSDSGTNDEVPPLANTNDSGIEVSVEDQLGYALAKTVYKNATASVPSSLEFRQHFLEALDAFEFDNKVGLARDIQLSISHDFSANELSWDWLARRQADNEEKAIEVYEDALSACPSSQMFELYAKFLTSLLDIEMEGSNSRLDIQVVDQKYDRHVIFELLVGLHERAIVGNVYSEALAIGHLELLLRNGRPDEASDLGRRFCNMMELKKSAGVWEWRMKLDMKRLAFAEDQDRGSVDMWISVLNMFREAVKNVSFSDSKRLWLLALEFFGGKEGYIEIIIELVEKALAGSSGGQMGADIACVVLNCVLHSQGIKQARQLYQRLLRLPGPSAEFIKLCITIEGWHIGSGCTESFSYLRKLFDEAVELFGQTETDVWINYCREELKAGNVDAANNVYWRARKALRDSTDFIEKHQML